MICLGSLVGEAKADEVVVIAIIREFRASESMLWPHGRDMGCGGDGALRKNARAGGKGRLDARRVRCWSS